MTRPPQDAGRRRDHSGQRNVTEWWLFTTSGVHELGEQQRLRLIDLFSLGGLICGLLFGGMVYALGGSALISLPLVGGALAVALTPYLVRRLDSTSIAGHIFAGAVLGSSITASLLRGSYPAGTLAFLVVIPLVTRYLCSARASVLWTAAAAVGATGVYGQSVFGWVEIGGWGAAEATVNLLEVVGTVFLLGLVSFVASAHAQTQREAAVRQQERVTDRLRQARRLESIGHLASGVAHDFNNLLTIILNITALLRRSGAEDVKEAAAEIETTVESAAGLTRQLLLFSREEEGEPELVDVPELLAGTYGLFSRSLGAEIKIELRIGQGLWKTRIDRGQLEQVLLNLTVNARDAMHGRGTLTIEVDNSEVGREDQALQQTLPPGRYVHLAVSDDGVGMPPEVAERIFEPFYTTKEKGVGTGMGLSTVYGIVRKANGDIWVDSSVGQGATFHIYLPAADAVVALDSARRRKGPTAGNETILLVEDDDAVRASVERALDEAGYAILSAGNAAEAIRLAGSHHGKVDLLLTDVVMPTMSGPELASHLTGMVKGMRVLFMTGHADAAVREYGVEASAANVMHKPLRDSEIRLEVRRVLDDDAAPDAS